MAGNSVQWYGPERGSDWNSTRVYKSDTGEDGAYVLIDTVSPITTTFYWDKDGETTSYYKISFYNTTKEVEGPLTKAIYASSTYPLYTNPTELRKFMQFMSTDFPNDEDTTLILEQAHTHLEADKGNLTNPARLKILALYMGSSYICRALATRALSKGYVSVSLQGGNIMKAHNELIRLSEYYFEKYQEFLAKDTKDYAITTFLNTGRVDPDTAREIRDIMSGVSNAMDYQSNYRPSTNNRVGTR